ncbi:MAG: hypothetical protein EHM68_02820 [Lysobacterales bacterium]|nr:MAG: hypothetical protein EHM68_02820 [Xanthomonadales bacterium]
MKRVFRSVLPALIAAGLYGNAAAQDAGDECVDIEGTPPGLYATTDEGRTFLIKDGKVVELGPGQTGFADEGEIKCINRPPDFLDWPCATQAAQSRMFNTYSVDDLSSGNKMKEVVDRYFQVPEVIAPIPTWVDGEYHAIFSYDDIIQFSSPDYWYHADPNVPILSGKRPRSLLIALFVGTSQVMVDNNMIDALREELGDDIPVTFVFNDSNTVPISYFGANVSLEEVFKAFIERGIKAAEVPMWWQGDYHLTPTIEEFEKFFKIPPLDAISAEKQAALKADLEAHGFSRKSIIVSLFSESRTMAVDQPERVRVAASLGIKRIPTSFSFVEPDSILARCGPGTPAGSSGVSGSTTPIGGAIVPPTTPTVPPPPEPEASDS